jgi:hypothetical protein
MGGVRSQESGVGKKKKEKGRRKREDIRPESLPSYLLFAYFLDNC